MFLVAEQPSFIFKSLMDLKEKQFFPHICPKINLQFPSATWDLNEVEIPKIHLNMCIHLIHSCSERMKETLNKKCQIYLKIGLLFKSNEYIKIILGHIIYPDDVFIQSS